jgi:hypothetical protein
MAIYSKKPPTIEAYQWNVLGDGPMEGGKLLVKKATKNAPECYCRADIKLHGMFVTVETTWSSQRNCYHTVCPGYYIVRKNFYSGNKNWDVQDRKYFEDLWELAK